MLPGGSFRRHLTGTCHSLVGPGPVAQGTLEAPEAENGGDGHPVWGHGQAPGRGSGQAGLWSGLDGAGGAGERRA
jgi:hypothetical protein